MGGSDSSRLEWRKKNYCSNSKSTEKKIFFNGSKQSLIKTVLLVAQNIKIPDPPCK